MPLPFAPKPEESHIYQSLKDVLVSDLTVAQMDSLRETVYAQGTDGAEDEYRRLLLLSWAASVSSSSGPLPGTGKIVRQSGFDATEITFFKPDSGQVYLLTGAAATSIGGGTSIYLFLSSGSVTSHVLIDRTTSANAPMTLNEPIYLDDTVYLTVRTEGAPSGTPALNASFIRVR